MMLRYAHLRGLRRLMIPVPVLTPKLSSYWVNLVTTIPAHIARPLIEGLRNEVVVRDPQPAKAFAVTPVSYDQAVTLAIGRSNVRKGRPRGSICRAPRSDRRSIYSISKEGCSWTAGFRQLLTKLSPATAALADDRDRLPVVTTRRFPDRNDVALKAGTCASDAEPASATAQARIDR